MKKSFLLSFFLYFNLTTFTIAEVVGREGFNFGVGGIAGYGDDTLLPGFEIESGYDFSNQFDLGVSLKVLLGAAMLSAKGKYYMYYEEDTPYVSMEVGKLVAIRDEDDMQLTYAGGLGYAFGHKEVELNVIWDRYQKNDSSNVLFLFSYRYLW